MSNSITSRLAATGIDFGVSSLPKVFRIFESLAGDGILKISLFSSSEQKLYLIADFKNSETAKHIYDLIDGFAIEDTSSIFNFSFVPDDFELDTPLCECTSSEEFTGTEQEDKEHGIDENMVQLSDDLEVDFEIPAEYRSGAEPVDGSENGPTVHKAKPADSEISKQLKEKTKAEDADDFKFDIHDSRFKALYESDSFIIDASNKKNRQQRASKAIIEERRRRGREEP